MMVPMQTAGGEGRWIEIEVGEEEGKGKEECTVTVSRGVPVRVTSSVLHVILTDTKYHCFSVLLSQMEV